MIRRALKLIIHIILLASDSRNDESAVLFFTVAGRRAGHKPRQQLAPTADTCNSSPPTKPAESTTHHTNGPASSRGWGWCLFRRFHACSKRDGVDEQSQLQIFNKAEGRPVDRCWRWSRSYMESYSGKCQDRSLRGPQLLQSTRPQYIARYLKGLAKIVIYIDISLLS